MAQPAARDLRTVALKLEAVWWLSRLYLNNPPIWMALAGWLAATGGRIGDPGRFGLLMTFVVLASSTVMIQNDVADMEEDRVTASYLPLPAGLIGRRAAVAAGAVASGVAAVALWFAAESWLRFLACLGLLALSTASTRLYSLLKHTGFLASLLIGVPFSVTPLIAWLAAGGQDPVPAGICAVYGYVFGVSANIQAALRDVDLDPAVGNLTLPVRIGARWAFAVAAALALADFAPVAAIIVLEGSAWSIPVALVALGLMVWSLPATARTLAEKGRGRVQRIADMRLFKLAEFLRHAALACALALVPGLVAAFVLQAMLVLGQRSYQRRIVAGGLRRSLAAPRHDGGHLPRGRS